MYTPTYNVWEFWLSHQPLMSVLLIRSTHKNVGDPHIYFNWSFLMINGVEHVFVF